jgi:hypothetical protein
LFRRRWQFEKIAIRRGQPFFGAFRESVEDDEKERVVRKYSAYRAGLPVELCEGLPKAHQRFFIQPQRHKAGKNPARLPAHCPLK